MLFCYIVCEKDFYRLRISNLPATTTKEELVKLLRITEEHSTRLIFKEDQDKNSSSVVAYLIHQRALKYLRSLIHQLHNHYGSDDPSNKVKCQVEINADFYNWDDDCNSNQTNKSKSSPWCELDTEQLNDNSSEEIVDMGPARKRFCKN